MELQIDDDPLFGGVDEDVTDDLDAAEITAGLVSPSIGSQPGGVSLYARCRHEHYIGGVPRISAWSNVETKTLTASDDEDYAAWVAAAA